MKFVTLLTIACLVCSATCQIILNLPSKCREVTIKGKINDNALGFGVDFFSTSEKGKIPFHFNFRSDPKWSAVPYIVLNSNDGFGWNAEVNKVTSLKPGSEFKLRIFFNEYSYDVYLNDEYFNSLPWRMDHFNLAQNIRIVHDVKITSISRTFYFSSVDYQLPFEVNLDSSTEVVINGRVGDKADFMVFDLLNGKDCSFHASFRFNTNNLVLNNLKNNQWQAEQVVPLPVNRGQQFTHRIVSDSNGFTLSGDDFTYTLARPAPTTTLSLHDTKLSLNKITLIKRY